MEFANKTAENFDLLPPLVPLDTTGTPVTTTKKTLGVKLSDLSRLSYIRGEVKFVLALDGAITQGQATVRLTDGANDFGSLSVQAGDEDSYNRLSGVFPASLAGINGDTRLYLALDVSTAFDAGVSGEFNGLLVAEHPVYIGGAC